MSDTSIKRLFLVRVTPGMTVAKLIRAAEAALGSGEREGPGSVIG